MAQFAEVFDAGLTTHIGVSNFTKRYIDAAKKLLGNRAVLVNQVEIHPFMQNAPIVDYCKDSGIIMEAFSPLARGAVADDAVLSAIGRDHDATVGQITLAHLMAKGHVVLPFSGNKSRIAENFVAQDIDLTNDQVAQIDALERGERLVNGPWCPECDV